MCYLTGQRIFAWKSGILLVYRCSQKDFRAGKFMVAAKPALEPLLTPCCRRVFNLTDRLVTNSERYN